MKFAGHAGNMKLGILLLVTGLLVTNAFGGSDAQRRMAEEKPFKR